MQNPDSRPAPANAVATQTSMLHPGEVFVWLSACGLCIGLLMVLGLLAVVLTNGIYAFWPKPIALITVTHKSTDTPRLESIAGEIITRRQKPSASPDTRPEEIQIYTANKDAFGSAFQFIDVTDISQLQHPRGICRMERMEYGPAIGIPKSLLRRDGTSTDASSIEFASELKRQLADARTRRSLLKTIEKSQIGAINKTIESIEIRQRALRSKPGEEKAASELARLDQKKKSLQATYDELDQQRRTMREAQSENTLIYSLPNGEERKTALGDILSVYFPNQMSVPQKAGFLLSNLGEFLRDEPREANTEGGIFPALFGTLSMTLLMSLAVMPFGVVAAIYLREYASQGLLVRCVRIAVNNLAGVPSIVFGVFGLGFFVYLVGGGIDAVFFSERLPTPTMGTGGIMWAALTLALMTVPVVVVATEEALAAVPRSVREGSLACGASKWQTIQRVVLPASAPGILTGLILAMARGAGEVAPLMLVGVVKLAPELPFDSNFPFAHLDQKFMHLGFHIYDLGFQSPDSEAAKPMVFATTLVLIALILALNLTAIVVRERLRRRYSTGAI